MLGYVAGDDGHTLTDPIYGLPLVALYGGAALYLLGLVAFKYRTLGRLSRVRLGFGVGLLVLIPLAGLLPALGSLGLLAAVLAALIGFETHAFAEQRDLARHADPHGHA